MGKWWWHKRSTAWRFFFFFFFLKNPGIAERSQLSDLLAIQNPTDKSTLPLASLLLQFEMQATNFQWTKDTAARYLIKSNTYFTSPFFIDTIYLHEHLCFTKQHFLEVQNQLNGILSCSAFTPFTSAQKTTVTKQSSYLPSIFFVKPGTIQALPQKHKHLYTAQFYTSFRCIKLPSNTH